MVHVVLAVGDDRQKTARKVVDDLGHPFWKACKEADYLFLKGDSLHPDFESLYGILDTIRLYADTPVVIGDAPLYGAKQAFASDDFRNLVEAYRNVHLLDLTLDDTVDSTFIRDEGGELIVRRAKTAVMAPFRLTLGRVKDWAHGTWIVPPRDTPQGRAWNRGPWEEALTPAERERLIAELFLAYPCQATVISGMLRTDPFIASMDPLAAETVLATIKGSDAHLVPHLEQIAAQGPWTNEISDTDVPPAAFSQFLAL
jgi:hypothetical protein